jgi:hypothetical protein
MKTRFKGKGVLSPVWVLIAGLALVCAGCTGSYTPDTDGGGGTGGGGSGGNGTKPAKLPGNATYAEAVAKIGEIIAYCDAHPGTTNNEIKEFAQLFPSMVTQSDWDYSSQEIIRQINSLIDELESSGSPGGGGGDGGSEEGGGGFSVGCAGLSAGTQCHEQSVCSGRFLCLTGQGSDSDCAAGCSCQ